MFVLLIVDVSGCRCSLIVGCACRLCLCVLLRSLLIVSAVFVYAVVYVVVCVL